MSKVASTVVLIWDIPPTKIAMGADRVIQGVRITEGIRRMMEQLGIDEATWIASARRRAAGRQDEILGSLGKRVLGSDSSDLENRATMPSFGGFREAK